MYMNKMRNMSHKINYCLEQLDERVKINIQTSIIDLYITFNILANYKMQKYSTWR